MIKYKIGDRVITIDNGFATITKVVDSYPELYVEVELDNKKLGNRIYSPRFVGKVLDYKLDKPLGLKLKSWWYRKEFW